MVGEKDPAVASWGDVNQQHVRLDSDALPWRATPFPGVQWKKLAFDDRPLKDGGGMSTVLLQFAPGASYGMHRHPRGEQYLVLEGTLQDGGESYGKGSYVWHPPGSAHRPSSKDGCVLVVTLGAPIEALGPSA